MLRFTPLVALAKSDLPLAEVDEHQRVIRGRLVIHSKNRDEVDREAIRRRLKHSASLYTGTIPEGTAIVV